ncbi:MAG: hypothetical protein KF860_09380 [Cyclobacteriaceae bacterium]|nr:hypothetical protein [Cyclobacteriaceae bacterium]
MKVLTENYKGIEFIRISKLPDEQRKQIVQALPSDKIIKILRDNELLTDCVQFKHYEAWFDQNFKEEVSHVLVKSNSYKMDGQLIPNSFRDDL